MADQQDSRIDANSSSPRQVHGEGQLALTDAANARRVAEARAAEAAFNAASHRPAQNNMTGSVQQALQEFKRGKGK